MKIENDYCPCKRHNCGIHGNCIECKKAHANKLTRCQKLIEQASKKNTKHL